jgi:hypothetical protein
MLELCSTNFGSSIEVSIADKRPDRDIAWPARGLEQPLTGLAILPDLVIWLPAFSPNISPSLLAVNPPMRLLRMILDLLKGSAKVLTPT